VTLSHSKSAAPVLAPVKAEEMLQVEAFAG
jgi:hypothetical protein